MNEEMKRKVYEANGMCKADIDRHIKQDKDFIFDSVNEWFDSLGKEITNCMLEEFDTNEDGLKKMVIDGNFPDVETVKVDGKMYVIEFCC